MLLTRDHIASVLRAHTPVPMDPHGHRKACVMVTLVEREGILHLLLTKRTDTVEHHKGQISFPGGMADELDTSNDDTALRELHEEIGVDRSAITVLGTLDDIHIPTGFIVTPVVGYIRDLPNLCTSAAEVAEVLLIPLERFFDPSLHRSELWDVRGHRRLVHFYDVWKEPVWGATAHIIHQLTGLLTAAEHA